MTTPGHSVPDFESPVVDSDCLEDKLNNTIIDRTTKHKGKKGLRDCNAILFQEIILNGVKDGKDPSFDGLVCLADGRLVIVDYDHSICCLYDSSYTHMTDFKMLSRPWNVCTIDNDEVAVSLPEEKKIQFLKVGDTIQPSGHITTRHKCRSLVALNKTEPVYDGTMKDVKTYYWGTITRDGREKSCFHIPRFNITYADVNIALNSCKTRVYISCHDDETVFCFDLDGTQHFEYNVREGPNHGKPFGISLDNENNVYVVFRNLRSIHCLSTECLLQHVIKDIIPEFRKAICFKHSGDNFLLTSNCATTSNMCYSYKLK